MVERVLRRVLGHERHTELADLLHEVFVQAMSSAHKLRDPGALRAWLQGIAVYTACRTIRYRKARRWLRFYGPEELPEQPSMDVPHEVREAFARTYAVLERMPAAERAVFSLRYVEGMQVDELARALDVSASTVKRRLGKAVQRFLRLARNDRVLAEWLGDKDVEQ
jgi:RNA polymerase sigma-70 factor (ECF subfamily)